MLYLSWSLATTPKSKPEEMSPYAHNFSGLKLLEEEQERLGWGLMLSSKSVTNNDTPTTPPAIYKIKRSIRLPTISPIHKSPYNLPLFNSGVPYVYNLNGQNTIKSFRNLLKSGPGLPWWRSG